jgi:hypothetical protein
MRPADRNLYHRFFGAFPGSARGSPRKPGFPLQVLGFAQDAWASCDFAKEKSRPANANPVGFPLQSLARRTSGWPREFAKANSRGQ